MTQMFTACIRQLRDGAFLPYVDVIDAGRGLEWEELHPDGAVADEADAHARANALADALRREAPIPSPGERYRRAHQAEPSQPQPAASVAAVPSGSRAGAGFIARLTLHERLLSGGHGPAWLAPAA